ncbi:NUDIX hydrolase [Rhodococcoides corynebacterioides]|uniref:NUDIX hydrolase n=1 Tax=Rhodococcoides corynebacterioides TaxID=53972 RepID=UPI0008318950|nr:NUDIX hydrolase [Rhodococcus corynebacterioides]
MSVPVRDASTVVLVRDGEHGLEVFLQRRVKAMAFAAGMTVYPGGGVDASDRTAPTGVDPWVGPAPSWWAEQFGTDTPTARALVLAAVRETFEECGILLAGPDEHAVVADTAAYAAGRRAVESRDIAFSEFLADTGLSVRADLLRPAARWITPEGETTRRYDTRFFLAVVPTGQRADDATSEAVDAGWFRPADALADLRTRARTMMPPTWSTLADLAEHDTVADAFAASYRLDPVQPVLVRDGEHRRVEFPGAERYYAAFA